MACRHGNTPGSRASMAGARKGTPKSLAFAPTRASITGRGAAATRKRRGFPGGVPFGPVSKIARTLELGPKAGRTRPYETRVLMDPVHDPSSHAKPEDKLRVLVIDDEQLHAEAVAESLERVGYECVVATSGSAGA